MLTIILYIPPVVNVFCIFLLYFVMTVFSELLHTVLFRGENMIGVTRLATGGNMMNMKVIIKFTFLLSPELPLQPS